MTKKTSATTKRSSTTKKAASAAKKVKKEICFVIMPFGGWHEDYYESIYRPAIETSGFKPIRADDLYRPGTIVNDIWSFTQSAKIVLADLTDKNPNVFYELGLAHALAKPALLVSQSMDDVPFDLRALRVLLYDKNKPDWGNVLREKITKAIGEVIEAPTEAVLPTFLSVKPGAKAKPVSEQDKFILELRRDVDLLRHQLRSSQGFGPTQLSKLEARYFMKLLEGMDISSSSIIKYFVKRGVPEDWICEELQKWGRDTRQMLRFDDEK